MHPPVFPPFEAIILILTEKNYIFFYYDKIVFWLKQTCIIGPQNEAISVEKEFSQWRQVVNVTIISGSQKLIEYSNIF